MVLHFPPALSTGNENLRLRQIRRKDAAPLFDLIQVNRDHLGKSTERKWMEHDTFEVLALATHSCVHEQVQYGTWLHKGWFSKTLVGLAVLEPDTDIETSARIGFWIGIDYCGQGFGTHIVSALTQEAIAQGFRRLHCVIKNDNFEGQGLLNKLGYRIDAKSPKSDLGFGTSHFEYKI